MPVLGTAFFSSGFFIPSFTSVSFNFFSAFSNADNSLASLTAAPESIAICLACISNFLFSMSVSAAIFFAFKTNSAVFLLTGIGGGFIGIGGGGLIPLALFSKSIIFFSCASSFCISS